MKILTSGCSFTHAPNSWANHLRQDYEIDNVAEGGAGNEMNIRNAMINIHKKEYTHCITQITGINRFEVVVEKHIDTDNNFLIANKNYTWIKSTGDQEWWLRQIEKSELGFTNIKLVSDALDGYLKYCYSDNQQVLKTLMSIVNLQTLCKQKRIKQLYFCWKNEFDQYMETIAQSSELTAWWDQIDWSMFWFHNRYDGLSEWGIDNRFAGALDEDHTNKPPKGWLMIDGKKSMIGHPSSECHKAFAEKVIKKWI